MSGELRLEFAGGIMWSCCSRMPSILPTYVHQVISIHHEIKTVLIVEKEAVFNNLLFQLPAYLQENMLIVTGKGFPSHSLINLLSKFQDSTKFLMLVDWDPYGLEIAYCYQQRLGRYIYHVAACGELIFHSGWLHEKTLDLSYQDLKKIKSLLKRLPLRDPLRKEAEYMLHFGTKLELDIIESEKMCSLIERKMAEK